MVSDKHKGRTALKKIVSNIWLQQAFSVNTFFKFKDVSLILYVCLQILAVSQGLIKAVVLEPQLLRTANQPEYELCWMKNSYIHWGM